MLASWPSCRIRHTLGAPFPGNPNLEIRLSDTTYTSPLLSYLACNRTLDVYWYTCGVYIPSGTQYIYRLCDDDSADMLYTRRLQKGDTVRFAFQGEFHNTGSIFWADYCDCGTVEMETPTPPGCPEPNSPNERLIAFIHLLDTVVTIVEHTPHEIWPYLPDQHNGDSRGADRPGYDPKRGFSITVRDPLGRPVPGVQVRIGSQFDSLSRGHEHNKPILPADRSGLFYKAGTGSNPKTLTTDSAGTAVVDSFRTSQIGGRFLITASLASDSTKKDTVNLNVRAPNLIDFAAIQTNYWGLTGNSGLTSYSGCPNTPIRHPSNHWGTQAMADALQIVLIRFLQWGGTQDGGGRFLKLDLNDMSLEKGGVFDICSTWDMDRGHSFHRIGTSVDIENRRRDFETGQILGSLKVHPDSSRFNEWGIQLERIMNQWGGRRYPEGPIHFGFGGN